MFHIHDNEESDHDHEHEHEFKYGDKGFSLNQFNHDLDCIMDNHFTL